MLLIAAMLEIEAFWPFSSSEEQKNNEQGNKVVLGKRLKSTGSWINRIFEESQGVEHQDDTE